MTLIVIFIALACERSLSHLRQWRTYDWFERYLERLQEVSLFESAWRSPWGLLLLVPPLLAVGLLQSLLQGGVLTLLGLVFAVLVLVFALGPRDLWEEVHKLIAAHENEDTARAEILARDLCRVGGYAPSRPSGLELVRGVVLQAHERIFGVLLWFFILGPLGAAGYRLIADLPERLRTRGAGEDLLEAAVRLHGLAAWVPLHVTALIYGLAGSTDGALEGRRRAAGAEENWVAQGWRLLADTGHGALQMETGADHRHVELDLDKTLRQALGLVTRSLIILLAVFAAFTIGGWIA